MENSIGFLAYWLSSRGLHHPPVRHEEVGQPLFPPIGHPSRPACAGRRVDYEEGAVVTLTLDEQGNGSHPGKTAGS